MSLRIESTFDDDLHSRMKNSSVNIHNLAETTNFMKHFVACKIRRNIYKVFLAQLYYIYDALEYQAEENCLDEVFSAIYFPTELNRKSTIEEDLEYFHGSEWRNELEMLNSTKNYVNRINELGQQDPSLLVAHCYTRYLGDISGGLILKYRLKKTFSLVDDKGLQFYIFPEITDIKKFKALYRNRLNSLDADREQMDRIVDEVISAFQYNLDLFNELDTVAGQIGGYLPKD